MVNREEMIRTLIAFCGSSSKAETQKNVQILKAIRKFKNYKDVAKIVKADESYCSTILNQAEANGLVEEKEGAYGVYRQVPLLRSIKIDSEIRKSRTSTIQPTVRRKSKRVDFSRTKKEIYNYWISNFSKIIHPFDKTKSESLSKAQLDKAYKTFLNSLEFDAKNIRYDGLESRMLQAFVDYFNVPRTKKAELVNCFSALIKNFEPFMKKITFIKTADDKCLRGSLDENLIKTLISNFQSDIKETKDEYWKDKRLVEASFRVIYPYRHIEAHEARDYSSPEIEWITYYFWVSIILSCLELP